MNAFEAEKILLNLYTELTKDFDVLTKKETKAYMLALNSLSRKEYLEKFCDLLIKENEDLIKKNKELTKEINELKIKIKNMKSKDA